MTASIRDTQKRYGSLCMTTAIVAGFVLILLGERAVAKGLILGAIFGVLNFVLMGELLPATLGRARRSSVFVSLGSIFFRHALLAVPLVLSIKLEGLNFAATVVGVFMLQGVILGDHLRGLFLPKARKRI